MSKLWKCLLNLYTLHISSMFFWSFVFNLGSRCFYVRQNLRMPSESVFP